MIKINFIKNTTYHISKENYFYYYNLLECKSNNIKYFNSITRVATKEYDNDRLWLKSAIVYKNQSKNNIDDFDFKNCFFECGDYEMMLSGKYTNNFERINWFKEYMREDK